MNYRLGLDKHQTSGKLFGLDHLRAFAIIFVLFYHYRGLFGHPDWVNSVSKFGWTGVDLFFVLSGYLISSQLFAKIGAGIKISFKEFFLKRFFRIIPAYLFILVIYVLFPYCREREALASLWKFLTFTQNIGLDLKYQGTFSHAWSLCIEEQFYLLLPIVLILLTRYKAIRKGSILLVLLFAAGFLVRTYVWQSYVAPYVDGERVIRWYKWMYYTTYSRLDGLLTGVSIAAIFQFKPNIKEQWQRCGNHFIIVGLMVLAAAYFVCYELVSFNASVFGFPLVSLGYGLIVAGAISPSSFLYRNKSAITSQIATLSYALYLSHKIIMHITQDQFARLGIDKNSNLMLVICLITSITGAWLMNKIIEKPFLRIRDRLLVKNKKAMPRKIVNLDA